MATIILLPRIDFPGLLRLPLNGFNLFNKQIGFITGISSVDFGKLYVDAPIALIIGLMSNNYCRLASTHGTWTEVAPETPRKH